MSEKWEPQGAAPPLLAGIFFRGGKGLRNHIHQSSGRKHMALSNQVIRGEFNKGAM